MLYPLIIMLIAIVVIFEVACKRFWFYALLEHKTFLNFRPCEHRMWQLRFWYKPGYGYLPHLVVVSTVILALTSGGLTSTVTVCVFQAISLLLFLSASINTNDVMQLHEWAEKFCFTDTAELRDGLAKARANERAALKAQMRGNYDIAAATRTAEARTQQREELSDRLLYAVNTGYKASVDVLAGLRVVDESQLVADIHYMTTQRAKISKEHAEALRKEIKATEKADVKALRAQRHAELEELLREQWHYRLFDEIDDAGTLQPALGRMHRVPLPTKDHHTALERIGEWAAGFFTVGLSSRAWAYGAAGHTKAFMDDHKRQTLRWFVGLSGLAASLVVLMELYGFWVFAKYQSKPGGMVCEPQMRTQCSVPSCIASICTLRNGYIPAPSGH